MEEQAHFLVVCRGILWKRISGSTLRTSHTYKVKMLPMDPGSYKGSAYCLWAKMPRKFFCGEMSSRGLERLRNYDGQNNHNSVKQETRLIVRRISKPAPILSSGRRKLQASSIGGKRQSTDHSNSGTLIRATPTFIFPIKSKGYRMRHGSAEARKKTSTNTGKPHTDGASNGFLQPWSVQHRSDNHR